MEPFDAAIKLFTAMFQSSSVGDDGWNKKGTSNGWRIIRFNPHPSEMTDGT